MVHKNNKHQPSSPCPINIGDANVNDLCFDKDLFDAEVEASYFDKLKGILSTFKKKKRDSLVIGYAEHSVCIGEGEETK